MKGLLDKCNPSISLTKEKGTKPIGRLPKSLLQTVVEVKSRRPLCVANKAATSSKTLVTEGRSSRASYAGSLVRPYKNLLQEPPPPRQPQGAEGTSTETMVTQGPEDKNLQPSISALHPFTGCVSTEIKAQNFTQKMLPDKRAVDSSLPLCLQTGHSSIFTIFTFKPLFVFAKLLRPIRLSLRLFVLTAQLQLSILDGCSVVISAITEKTNILKGKIIRAEGKSSSQHVL